MELKRDEYWMLEDDKKELVHEGGQHKNKVDARFNAKYQDCGCCERHNPYSVVKVKVKIVKVEA